MPKEKLIIFPIRMTKDDHKRINEFCKAKGYYKAAWLMRLATEDMERDAAIQAGKTQLDPSHFQGGKA